MKERELKQEAKQASRMLRGKTVREVWRYRRNEVGIEFTDGSRLFVDCNDQGAEMSITEGHLIQSDADRKPGADDSEGEVIVRLTQSEALVLFDFCSRFSVKDKLTINDQAEERALWNLEAILERILPEPLQADYTDRVVAARERLRNKG